MFEFGFSSGGESRSAAEAREEDKEEKAANDGLEWFAASEVRATSEDIEREYPEERCARIPLGDSEVRVIRDGCAATDREAELCENIARAEARHSDLLPAIYEGGLKIWECSYDLGRYLSETDVPLRGKRVLDLGCGAGVLGILALLGGSSSVHFQDYNAEVLKLLTIRNVLLNLEDRRTIGERCEFYCGDWESFARFSSSEYPREEQKYHLVVSSETVYNPANLTKLYGVFKRRLRRDGVGYVAAKTHYFGVGGGMRQFERTVREDGAFDVEIVWKSAGGLQREIAKLVRRGA